MGCEYFKTALINYSRRDLYINLVKYLNLKAKYFHSENNDLQMISENLK